MYYQANIRNRSISALAAVVAVLLISACGSTKIYNNEKTVVYNGAEYSLSRVKQVNGKIRGKLSDTESVSLKNADQNQIEAYLQEYGSIYVRMVFELGQKEMLYRASSIEKWSQYSNMLDSFEAAEEQITSFMVNKRKMQLKLK